jgi:hypothetical protein
MENFLKSYKRTLEELRREYPEYNVWSDNYFFTFYGDILKEQILNEFITQTIDVDKTIQELDKRFNVKFPNVKVDQGRDFIIINFDKGIKGLFDDQFKQIDDINKFMDLFGWYPSKINGVRYNENTLQFIKTNSTEITIRYEGKFDVQITPNEKYYYHLTPDIYWSKIESDGLTPKSKSKLSSHPGRIYLIKQYDGNKFIELAKKLFNYIDPKTQDYIEKYYILKINVEDLIKSGRDKFYRDPNYSQGIWTYENIPPLYIEKTAEILVNKNKSKNIITLTKESNI